MLRKLKMGDLGKFIVKKTVALMTLWMISKKPHTGYEVIKAFSAEGMHAMTPSRVYPLLAKLEKEGMVSGLAEARGKRKVRIYNITPAGRKNLCIASKLLCSGMKGRFFREMLHRKMTAVG
ncbi:MAG: PadR family transcriptional regulator [Candidatus Micrarchaeia archaeon]